MGDQSLGSLSAKLELGTDGLDASVAKAVGGLNKVESTAKKAEKEVEHVGKTLQKALKGEVLVNAFNRVGSAITGLGKDFKGLGDAVVSAGAVLQGLFQGGLQGAAIAAAGVAISYLVKQFGELQEMIDATEKSTATVAASMVTGYAKVATSLAEVTRKLQVQNDAKALGITLTEAEFRLRAQEITGGIASLRASAAGSQALADEAKRSGRSGAWGTAAKFEAAAARDNFEADQKAAQLKLLESTLRLDKVTAETVKPLSAFAQAMKEARSWTVGGAGLERSPGEQARMDAARAASMNLGMMRDPDGSINSEARGRAQRNAGYAANAGDTLELDKPLHRIKETFDEAAAYVSSGILDSMTSFGESFAEAMENAADVAGAATQEAWSKLAPKTFAIAADVASGNIAGAIAGALSHSVEFQAVGKALDTGLVDVINALTEVLRPAVPVITMAINAVVSIAKIVGNVLEMLTTLSGMETVFAMVFEGVKFLAAALSVGAAATQYALDALTNNFKQAGIAFLSMFGEAFKTQIEDLKASLVAQGDFGAEMQAAWDAVMKVGFNAEQAAIGMGDAAAAADKVSQSFLNLPAGFKVASAMYDATGASGAALGGFAPPSASGMPPLSAAAAAGGAGSGGSGSGDVFNFYGPIYVSGDEGFTNVVTVSARQSGMTGNGSPAGRPPPQRPTPYPPNGTQPYTPVP